MAFSDHKIAAFAHKITDLPDQPNLPADELKARFDSSPEELRQAHNALCDDADRLDDRVSGIIAETFGDTISKSMLSDELAASVAWKSDLYYGFYTGDGVYPRTITVGFTPRLVYAARADGRTGSAGNVYHLLAAPVETPGETDYIVITANGFQLTNATGKNMLNSAGQKFVYFAVK